MARCEGCKNSCNCYISEDGFWGGHPELGRNFSRVQGSGTLDSPFQISFLDQLEFRPRTAEFQVNSQNLPNDSATTLIAIDDNTSTILYQSPLNFIFKDPIDPVENYKYIEGNFFVFGASVTFAETADSPDNGRVLVLSNLRSSGGVNVPGGMAGQSTPGGSADPLTLSCEALWAGTFTNIGAGQVNNAFSVHVLQRSGGPILLTDIRVWITEV